jgi:hypothetical protein
MFCVGPMPHEEPPLQSLCAQHGSAQRPWKHTFERQLASVVQVAPCSPVPVRDMSD